MLFSELNRINLNVLIQDSDYEEVPDINLCYVHNSADWTIWCKKVFEDENIVHLPGDDNTYLGWNVHEISSTPEEDAYLSAALTDISNALIVNEKNTKGVTDLVKIYAGEFDIDGTIDYNAFIDNEDICTTFGHPIMENRGPHKEFGPCKGAWWTFNNGAFQWIGGPKSIPECRFSYGPFNCPDPHHKDTNHKMLDEYLTLSKLPNLNFIFDTKHVLKGIVSLPCATEQLKTKTKNFIENFLNYAWEKYNEMTFKNIDEILKNFSKTYAYIPTIRVARKYIPKKPEKPVAAVFDLVRKPAIPISDDIFKYVFPDTNDLNSFIDRSFWKTYSIHLSFGIGPFPEIHEITNYLEDLHDWDTLHTVMDHVNRFSGTVYRVYNECNRFTLYTMLTEGMIGKNKERFDSAALMTLSDLFKHTKDIRKLIESLHDDKDIEKMHVIVLPEKFCNKNTLQLISNVRYVQ